MSRDRKEREKPAEREADFLSRWSRRKRDARHEPAEPEEQAAPAAAEDAPEKSEAEILEDLGLPDPETLGPGSDFRAFMAEAVPDVIRRKALRKLWTSNPVLANLDMLVDYGEDYTDKARVVANLQSAYRAGRGYLDRVSADAGSGTAEALPEEPESAPQETAATPEGAPRETADEAPQGTPEETAAAQDDPTAADPAADEEPSPDPDAGEAFPEDEAAPVRTTLAEMPPPRRRMRFDFD